MNTPTNDSLPPAPDLRRNRTQMLLVFLLFLGPFVLATLLFFAFPQMEPGKRLNHGQLVDPPKALPVFTLDDLQGAPVAARTFKGHWSLVQIGSASCDERCVKHLYMSRQVRTRLGRDARRVQRVYIALDAAALKAVHDALPVEHPDLLWLSEAGQPGQRASDFFKSDDADTLYLVDPLGNWIMFYPGLADADDFDKSTVFMKDLYADLKQLLMLSQVD